MDLGQNHKRFVDDKKLPEPVYELVVRSLYGDLKTLFVGTLSMVVAPLILYHRTGDPVQLWFSLVLGILGGLRLLDGFFFKKELASAERLARPYYWELRYAILGAAYVGALGTWCLAGFVTSSDPFVQEMGVIVTISYIIGILGRNFSSSKVVLSQTVFSGLPLILSITFFGDLYDLALGIFLLPLFLGIWIMSRNLRHMLFDAVLTALDNKVIADRFDVALSNVSHGMAMLDGMARFVVVNPPFAGLCGLPGDASLMNTALSESAKPGPSSN